MGVHKGIIQLLNINGDVCKEANCTTLKSIDKFKHDCTKLYGKKILECTFNFIPTTKEEKKIILPKEPKVIIPAEKLNIEKVEDKSLYMGKWKGKKNKDGVKGGSSGRKITQVRASRYW